jgi:hypothetical protein
MKKISLSFFLILLSIFLGSFSCQDHVVPDPQITTLPITKTQPPARLSGVVEYYYNFNLIFPELGNAVVEEYGVVYSYKGSPQGTVNATPTIGGTDCLTRIFTYPAIPAVNQQYSAFKSLPYFYIIYYRAYAKLQGGGIIYGEILDEEMDQG